MFLAIENEMAGVADFAQEDLAEILAVAEAEYADITVEAIRAEAAIAISVATEAGEEGAMAKAGSTLKNWAKKIGEWFKSMWAKISGFFKRAFEKVMLIVGSDEKVLKAAAEKMKSSGFKAKEFKGQVYPFVAQGKIGFGLNQIVKAVEGGIKSRDGITAAITDMAAGAKDSKGIGFVVSRVILGGGQTEELKTSDAAKALSNAQNLVSIGKKLKAAGGLAKAAAASSAKEVAALNSLVDKGDKAKIAEAKNNVEVQKRNATAVSITVSAILSAYNTARGQAMKVVRTVILGGSASAGAEAPAEKKEGEVAKAGESCAIFEDFGAEASLEDVVSDLEFA